MSRRLCLEICWLPIDWTTIGLAPPFPSLKADQIVLWGVLSSRFYIFFFFRNIKICTLLPFVPFAHHCDDNSPSSWVVASALKSVCQEDPASHWKVIVGSPHALYSLHVHTAQCHHHGHKVSVARMLSVCKWYHYQNQGFIYSSSWTANRQIVWFWNSTHCKVILV